LSIEGTVSKRIDAPDAPGNPRALDQPKILRYYDYFGWSCSHVDLGLSLWVNCGGTGLEQDRQPYPSKRTTRHFKSIIS